MTNNISLSPFWQTPNFQSGEQVFVHSLGPYYDGMEFRAVVKGVYACDVDGNPDAYILELLDEIPINPEYTNAKDDYVRSFSHHVFTRACVRSAHDISVKMQPLLTGD